MTSYLNLHSVIENTDAHIKKRQSEIRRGCKQVSIDACFIQDWLPLSTNKFPSAFGYSRYGAYMVKHIKDTEFNNIAYVGNGVISQRRNRIKNVFRNGGKAVVSKNGSSSDCRVASKMFQADSNLDNWLYYYIKVPKIDLNPNSIYWTDEGEIAEKFYVEEMERSLHEKFQPRYNLEGLIAK